MRFAVRNERLLSAIITLAVLTSVAGCTSSVPPVISPPSAVITAESGNPTAAAPTAPPTQALAATELGGLGSDPKVFGLGKADTGFLREMETVCLFRVRESGLGDSTLIVLFNDAHNNATLVCLTRSKFITVELWNEDHSIKWIYTIMTHDANTMYGDRTNPVIEELNDWHKQDPDVIRTIMNAIIEHKGSFEKGDPFIRGLKNAIEIIDSEGITDFEYLNGVRSLFD